MGTKGFLCMAFLSLLVWACATIEPERETQAEGDPPAVAQISPAILPEEPLGVQPTLDEPPDISRPQMSIPGVEEIRALQDGLRANGFNPGLTDGVLGPKTKQAWLRLESGCAMLKDLLETAEALHKQRELPLQKIASDRLFDQEEVRTIQVRLKDAGFDPGFIDGIVGPKTTSALVRLHSGCALIGNFSMSSSGELLYTKHAEPALQIDVGQSLTKNSARINLGRIPYAHDGASDEKQTVRQLQLRLKEAGFDPGPLDGVMGPKTHAALKRYEAYLKACDCQEISPRRSLQYP